MKSILFKIFILSIIVVLSYFVYRIPIFNIEELKKQFVATSFSDGQVSYTVTRKRPKSWANISNMPRHVYYAFIVSEDWSFYNHQGVDFRQIYIAIKDHLQGEKLRGASTISQQLVKNLYTKSERSLERKIFEMLTTMYIEKRLTKNQILETYLNIIEFGEGLYGIKNASWYYFKKRPKDLLANEAAFLAMLLPNPKLYSQSFRDKKLSEYARSTVNSILKKLKVTKAIDEEDLLALSDIPLVFEELKSSKGKLSVEEEFFEL